MEKSTQIILGDYFDNFINVQIQRGKYSSVNEVVKAAMELFEQTESKRELLDTALEKGIQSGFVNDFNEIKFLKDLNQRYTEKAAI
ncbi:MULTISPECIES: type II toxin-antitoxin system ParD family antitoxin [Myroides]|uniref:type II toxin-antitoxin system ParD family antitoxin n=1 Tax=Myroides TaxID=76831 RepID=UPI0013037FEF|nr:type II toxin-antitoxin system ParD family antitoxin [Myroides phaeus]